jgi:hypothetical protein
MDGLALISKWKDMPVILLNERENWTWFVERWPGRMFLEVENMQNGGGAGGG